MRATITDAELMKLNDFATEHWNAITEMPREQQEQYLKLGRMAAEGLVCGITAGSGGSVVDALRRLMEVNHRVGAVAWVYLFDRKKDLLPPLRAMELFGGASDAR